MPWTASHALALVGLVLTTACLNFDPYACNEDVQCVLDGEMGVCQGGWCSYVDEGCPSGYRYDKFAGGGLGGQCVDPMTGTSGPTTSGPTSEETTEDETTGTSASATNPVTTDPTVETTGETGDTCGAPGQPCCVDGCNAGAECFDGECSCVVSIDAGDHHTCAVLVDGSVYCWGANDVGQLGDSVRPSSLSPVSATAMLGPGMRAIDVSATRQTCAVREDGGALCWGDNASGQAAPADVAPIVPPTVASFVVAATVPATGGSHSCIARNDGTLMTCFGANDAGQITTGTAPGPLDVPALFQFAEIELGTAFGCGRPATGEVYCWGSNASGQLAADPSTLPTSDMLRTIVLAGAAADLAVGRNHACARVADEVYCWGANDVGQLGDGTGTQQIAPVLAMLPPGAVSRLEAGPNHTCAVLGNGELWCWGSNEGDQLLIDQGPDEFSLVPVHVPTGDLAVEDVTGGVEHACILTSTHQVHCWGPNTQGEAGVGMAGYVFVPSPIDLQCP